MFITAEERMASSGKSIALAALGNENLNGGQNPK
jgi:hypothetical protein